MKILSSLPFIGLPRLLFISFSRATAQGRKAALFLCSVAMLLASGTTPLLGQPAGVFGPTATPTPTPSCFRYVITLSGAEEVPPNGSTATGTATIDVNTVTNQLSYNITFSGLSSPEVAAHIHGFAPPGMEAGVIHGLPAGSPKIGVFNYSEAQEADILAGLSYVNIHTENFGGGEIRGQIANPIGPCPGTPTPTPSPTPTPTPTATPTPVCFRYVITLSGAEEVPPNGSTATGTATIDVNTITNQLSYNITFSGLSSPENAAHIHGFAPPGMNAGVIHGLPAGSPKIGVFNYAEAQEANILAGLSYVNIHTDNFGGGEIRGQIANPIGPCPGTPTPTPTATPTPTPTLTPVPTPTSSPTGISGTVTYCSNPALPPVPNVTMSLTGQPPAPTSTLTNGSGAYTLFFLVIGNSYTVTPTKATLVPGTSGINTSDSVAIQRHFLGLGTPLSGCRLAAADTNDPPNGIGTTDAIAAQRFFLGLTTGLAQTGRYKFTPVSTSYSPFLVGNMTNQNYSAVILGDAATGFVAPRPDGDPAIDVAGESEIASTVAALSLPNVAIEAFVTNFTLPVTTTAIDAKDDLVGFQGDFTFDERVITFQSEPVQKTGLTSGNWNVSGNVLDGTSPMRTLRVSAFSNDFRPLSGEGTLFELNMSRVSKAAQSTELLWAAPPDQFIFIDADLKTQQPGCAAPGSVAPRGGSLNR